VAFGPRLERPAQTITPQDDERRRQRAEARRAAEASQTPAQRQAQQNMLVNIDRTGRYVEAVRDWVAKGADSVYALSPDEVVARSRPRPAEFGLAAAEFELGQYLHRAGNGIDAVPHFKEAHRLDPTNWSYLRQALAVADPGWGQLYDRDMLTEVAEVGAETFYLPLEL
jgi:hypothetical protein